MTSDLFSPRPNQDTAFLGSAPSEREMRGSRFNVTHRIDSGSVGSGNGGGDCAGAGAAGGTGHNHTISTVDNVGSATFTRGTNTEDRIK